ncbi:peptidase domain-containing ABC transporter [Tenacibaculum sp. FZY0031]|uniref:peptidase domain-containing ABC transporter n=1 Tax=Tenacibaculum sp. FZY0031 TaxID=3116648 RepID=UPI002EA42255|nr:peptidase domain-containing ABC transporter [Tenacibaculum sp. FZY0031]
MKLKFINQLESNDCGPACLAMVTSAHGKNVSLKEAKKICEVTRMGVSVKDILNGGEKLGFQSHGLKLKEEDLSKIPLPSILYWKQDHFVVLYKIREGKKKKSYHIADPGYGKTVIDDELLQKEWLGNQPKGVALVFQKNDEKSLISFNTEIRKKRITPILKILLNFIKSNNVKYFFSLFLLLIGLGSNWLIPIIFQKVIDDGILAKSIDLVLILLLSQLFLFLGNFCSRFFSDYLLTKFNFKLSIILKESFLFKLMKLPVNYFDTRLNTDTLQRLTDLSTIQSFLTWKGISFGINTLNLIVFSFILLYLDETVFIIYLVLSTLSIVWVSFFLKKRAAIEYSMFIRQSDNSNSLYEFIMNMPEIKINQAQNSIISKIIQIQEKLNELQLKSLFLNMYQLSGANFILKLKELTVIAFCAYSIIGNNMSIGTLLSISYIIGQLSGPIINLINNLRDVQDASIAKRRVDDVYETKNEETDEDKKIKEIEIEDIELKSVSFKYPGSFNPFVINDLSITIPNNKITAIVGTSGSGKTTLMKLLMKYYTHNSGEIKMGNVDFEKFHSDAWRQKCGVVLQDGHIFSGSIKYNITLSNDKEININALKNALKIACLEELVTSLPLGIETKIGNVGIQLSGGQNQRVLIARAVYKNPEFIFFDEATSALDANTEKSILNNLNNFFKGKTVVVIAHRLSTVKNADQIIVIENGRLIEKGIHDELIQSKSQYYSLVKNQLELGS